MSTCISGGCGRTYKFDLDIVKPPSPSSPSTARASSQTCSSTLSESSNDSPLALSTKRARAPRKRPNQTYTEAAALLSSIYPNVFTTKDFKTLCKHTKEAPFDDPPEPPLLLPLPLPALDGHGFLLDKPTVLDKPNSPIELKRPNLDTQTSFEEAVTAPSDDEEEDYFGSILDEGVGEGIDSILGDISTDNLNWNPLGLGPFGFGRRFECGLGLRRALRRPSANFNNGFVRMLDIVTPKSETQTPLEKNGKKKKKKKAKRETEAEDPLKGVTVSADETGNSKGGLQLKLNFEGVLKEWSGSAFSDESSGDAVARLGQIDLFADTRNNKDEREASVMRYKEKRRTRLFSKKIRYQVRKLNADHRPRIKGRFVRRPNHSCSVDDEERELVS